MMHVKHSAQGLAGSCYFHHAAQSPSKALHSPQDKVQVLSIGPQARHHPVALLTSPAQLTFPLCTDPCVHRPSCRTTRSLLPPLALPPCCPPTSFGSLLHILLGASKGPPGGPESRATPLDPLLSFPHPDLKLRVPWGSLCPAHCLAHSRMSEGQEVGPPCRLPPEDLGPTLALFAGQVALACAQAEDTLGSETSWWRRQRKK